MRGATLAATQVFFIAFAAAPSPSASARVDAPDLPPGDAVASPGDAGTDGDAVDEDAAFAQAPAIAVPDAASGAGADAVTGDAAGDHPEQGAIEKVVSVWIEVGGRRVFAIHAGAAGFSIEERARIVSGRISKLARDSRVRSDSISVNEGEAGTDIVSGDVVVMTVTDLDAALEGKERRALALDHARDVRTAIEEYRRDFSLKVIFLGFVWSLLATGVLVAWFFLVRKLVAWSSTRIDSWRGRWIRSITVQRHVILPADRIAAALAGAIRIILHTLSVVIIYFYLNLVLSFFPWTKGFASSLLGFLVSLLLSVWRWIVSYSPDLAVIVVIVVVTWYLLGFVKPFFGAIAKGTVSFPGFPREWAEPTRRIARILLVAIAVVVAIPFLPGAGSLAFKGIAVFLAALLLVGSASSVSSLVAGVVLVYMRAYAEGDRVRIGDVEGEVVERSLLITRLRTAGHEEVVIPNAVVLKGRIVNRSATARERGVPIGIRVTVGRSSPRGRVEEVLLTAAVAAPGIRKDPRPIVRLVGMDEHGTVFDLTAFAMDPDDAEAVGSGLRAAVIESAAAAGIEVARLGTSPAEGGER